MKPFLQIHILQMKNQLKAYFAQVFFGMTSKLLYVVGMKTESEFADIYLDFIRKYGIPFPL
jgi:hypothetical protein